MSEWLTQTNLVKQIASQILLPKLSNYNEDYLSTNYINTIYKYLVYKMCRLKHLQFKNFKIKNQQNEQIYSTIIKNKEKHNQICIIFLHGYCSNRLQSLPLLDQLPKQIDLCCFDFSSSGKSQGSMNTFGLKQSKDIKYIINQLKSLKYKYSKFILWGRSMGAVSSFIFTCSTLQQDRLLLKDITFQVLDSPFNTFQQICHHQAKQSFKLPQTFIQIGISILKDYFKNHEYDKNPFNINLSKQAKFCNTNTLFIFNQNDHIIPQKNTMKIIQNLTKNIYYEKLIINENHNTLRKMSTIQEIFIIVKKYYYKCIYNQKNIKNIQQIHNKIQQNYNKIQYNRSKVKLLITNHHSPGKYKKSLQINKSEQHVQKQNLFINIKQITQPMLIDLIRQPQILPINLLRHNKILFSQQQIIQNLLTHAQQKPQTKQFPTTSTTISSQTYLRPKQAKYSFKKKAIYCSLHRTPTNSHFVNNFRNINFFEMDKQNK